MNYTDIYKERYLTHHGVKGMKWGVRRAVNAVTGRIREGIARRASHTDRRPLEYAQRNGTSFLTKRAKANIAKRDADETDVRIATKHKMIADPGKPVRKMSNAEIEKILKTPGVDKKLSDLSEKQMRNARIFTTALMVGYVGVALYSSLKK